MDRNVQLGLGVLGKPEVATREGGVDRNGTLCFNERYSCRVATREGGVDRNNGYIAELHKGERSPPARVAWIETPRPCCKALTAIVATREGGVDRNENLETVVIYLTVATREGGVDRN